MGQRVTAQCCTVTKVREVFDDKNALKSKFLGDICYRYVQPTSDLGFIFNIMQKRESF